MTDDQSTMQARALLRELHDHVETVSQKIEVLEGREPATSTHARTRRHRGVSTLRRELYEVHRLIDGIHRRFPETLPEHRRESTAACR